MRNANSQRRNSMIPVSALHQPSSPHVSHAETEGEMSDRPSLLRGNCVSNIFVAARRAEALPKIGGRAEGAQDGQRCALLTTKSRNTCTRATVFSSSG